MESGLPKFITEFGLSLSHMEHIATLPRSRRAHVVYSLRNLRDTLSEDDYGKFIETLNVSPSRELENLLEPHKLPYYELPSHLYDVAPVGVEVPPESFPEELPLTIPERMEPSFYVDDYEGYYEGAIPSLAPVVEEEGFRPTVEVSKPRVERAFGRRREQPIRRKPARRERVARGVEVAPKSVQPLMDPEFQVIQVIHKQAPRWYDKDFEYDYEYSRPMITAAKVSPSWTFVREDMGTSGIVEFYISPEGYRVVDWGTYGMYGPFRSRAKADEIFRDLTNSYY